MASGMTERHESCIQRTHSPQHPPTSFACSFSVFDCPCYSAHEDHRGACATSGFLASRALPGKLAIARVCREPGAPVGRNVQQSHHEHQRAGARSAVDAIVVSPLTGALPGVALRRASTRKRRQTYPELGHAGTVAALLPDRVQHRQGSLGLRRPFSCVCRLENTPPLGWGSREAGGGAKGCADVQM